jgi:hypothetical protein
MRNLIISLICIFSLFSCKTKSINQTVERKREGLWTEKYSHDSAHYRSVGKYKNDNPIKRWRYYLDGKIIKREKYKGNICYTKFYHENGKIRAKGVTKIEDDKKQVHWYYSGTWKYYDNKSNLTTTRQYNKGDLISEENNTYKK